MRECGSHTEFCERGRNEADVEGVVNMRCRGHHMVRNILASKRIEQIKKRLKAEQLKRKCAAETEKGAPHGPRYN